MTEERYWQIRDEYKVSSISLLPSKKQIEEMTEEELREQMEILEKAFEEAFEEQKHDKE